MLVEFIFMHTYILVFHLPTIMGVGLNEKVGAPGALEN